MQNELDSYRTEQKQYENDRKSAARFLKLVERYISAEEMSTLMLNEFVEEIIVHERHHTIYKEIQALKGLVR